MSKSKKSVIIIITAICAFLIITAALSAGITYSVMNKGNDLSLSGSYSMAGEGTGSKNVLALSVIDEKNESDGNYKIYRDNKLTQSGKYVISSDKKSATLYQYDKPCAMIYINDGKYYYTDSTFSPYEITRISDSELEF